MCANRPKSMQTVSFSDTSLNMSDYKCLFYETVYRILQKHLQGFSNGLVESPPFKGVARELPLRPPINESGRYEDFREEGARQSKIIRNNKRNKWFGQKHTSNITRITSKTNGFDRTFTKQIRNNKLNKWF